MWELLCAYCGGNPTAPDHDAHCDGKQGGRPEPITIPRIRETSALAFYNLDPDTVKTQQERIFVALLELGAATAGEVDLRTGLNFRNRARFAELRAQGLIREVGKRQCGVTGQTCITWEVVPAAEYVGVVVVEHRCPLCGQIVSKELTVESTENTY